MQGFNITLVAADGTEKNSGKIVRCGGVWVYSFWTRPAFKRRDMDGYGITRTVVEYAIEHFGVRDYYLYASQEDATYHTTDEMLLAFSTVTNAGKWGEMLNVSVHMWTRSSGRLASPWIPNDVYRKIPVILPTRTETAEPVTHAELTQTSLFE